MILVVPFVRMCAFAGFRVAWWIGWIVACAFLVCGFLVGFCLLMRDCFVGVFLF